MPLKKVLIIFGPTASGKSDKALRVSSKLDSIIINADSLQVYKQLKIITSRPTKSDEKKIDHKLYGIMDGKDNCSVASWLTLVKKEIENCWLINKLPIVVGGTGMYLKALTEGIAEIPTIPNNIKLETEKLKNIHGLDYLYDCDCVWLLLLLDRARLLINQAFALILKLAKPDFLRLKPERVSFVRIHI